jgi:hypothetical protein
VRLSSLLYFEFPSIYISVVFRVSLFISRNVDHNTNSISHKTTKSQLKVAYGENMLCNEYLCINSWVIYPREIVASSLGDGSSRPDQGVLLSQCLDHHRYLCIIKLIGSTWEVKRKSSYLPHPGSNYAYDMEVKRKSSYLPNRFKLCL